MSSKPPIRIAIIDTHPLMRIGLAQALRAWPVPHELVEACDGLDYERVVREVGHVHLAVVGTELPRRDGYETMRWCMRHHARTLLVAFMAQASPAGVRKALQCGARAVLQRVVAPDELYRALTAVLNHGIYLNDLVSRDLRRSAVAEQEPTPQALWATLTRREREVVELYTRAGVRTLNEVAGRLGIAVHTADTHRRKVYAKLGLHGKDELVRFVLTNHVGGD